jgi:MFS family permease
MSYSILMPVVARDVLHVGSQGYGFLQTAGGIGGLLGTLAVARLARSGRRGWQIILGATAFGLLIVAFAFSSSYVLSFVLLFGMGATNQMYMTSVNTSLQLHTPDEFRGRVMGLWGLTWSLVPLGGTISGTVAEFAGPQVALAIGGALVTALALGVAASLPRVRKFA